MPGDVPKPAVICALVCVLVAACTPDQPSQSPEPAETSRVQPTPSPNTTPGDAAPSAGAAAPPAAPVPSATTTPPVSAARPVDSSRRKPYLGVLAVLGDVEDGTASLTSAIIHVSNREHGGRLPPRDGPALTTRGTLSITMRIADVRSAARTYAVADFATHGDAAKALFTGAVEPTAFILVVSAVHGVRPQLREHVRLAQRLRVPAVVVAVTGPSSAPVNRIAAEVRELLTSNGYRGNVTVVPVGDVDGGSVRLKADTANSDVVTADAANTAGAQPPPGVVTLMGAIDSGVAPPVPDRERPLMMPIDDRYEIAGRGPVAAGRIEFGRMEIGDEVELVGFGATRRSVIVGIETFRKLLKESEAGDRVGVLLRGVDLADIERGQVIAQPGSIRALTRFEAEAYLFPEAEGGRRAPLSDGYRPQIYVRNTDVTGVITLGSGREQAAPGDQVPLSVQLLTPVAIELGTRFVIREGPRSVGAGVVTALLP